MLKNITRILCLILVLSLVATGLPACHQATASNTVEKITTEASATVTETTTEEITTETTTEATTAETTTRKVVQPVKITDLQTLVDATAVKYNTMSIQVATIVDGQVYATAQNGWAEKNVRAMTEDTKIRVASLSKTILSLVVYRLIDEGLLNLDADISEYLGITVQSPSYPDVPITLRVIMSHTSGLVDASYTHSLEQLCNHLQKPSAYTRNKPGTVYAYNNFAFGIVGTICELVTGKSVTTLLNEYFFNPMGIDASYIPAMLDSNEIAVLYDENHSVCRGVKTQQNQLKFTEEAGAGFKLYSGGMTISAKDYAKLLTILMNDGMYNGVRYLSSESVRLIHSVQNKRVNGKIGQGMPLLTRYKFYGGKFLHYHTGSAYGVFSLYTYDPETKTGVVILTIGAREERDAYSIYAVCGEIARGIHQNGFVE